MDSFAMRDEEDGTHFLHDISLCNRDTGTIFYDQLVFIYLELINYVKAEADLGSDLDRWLYVLKNMSKMDNFASVSEDFVEKVRAGLSKNE